MEEDGVEEDGVEEDGVGEASVRGMRTKGRNKLLYICMMGLACLVFLCTSRQSRSLKGWRGEN